MTIFKRCLQVSILICAMSFVSAVANPPSSNPWLNVPNFWIDEQNVSGLASNFNSCTSQSKPCLTNAQVFYRMGGISPELVTTPVIFHEMSDVVVPVSFHPCVYNTFATFEGVM